MDERCYFVTRDEAPEDGVLWAGFFTFREARALAALWEKSGSYGCVMKTESHCDDGYETEIFRFGRSTAQERCDEVLSQRTSRRDPRREVHARVQLQSSLGQLVWGEICNLSRGGMFVKTDVPFAVDSELTAEIDPGDEQPLRARIRVARSKQGEGFGCYFTKLSRRAGEKLDQWLGQSGGLLAAAGTIEV